MSFFTLYLDSTTESIIGTGLLSNSNRLSNGILFATDKYVPSISLKQISPFSFL